MGNAKHKRKEGVKLFVNKELELEVRAVKNEDGSISVNAEDAAVGFGFTTVAKSGNKVVRWSRVNKYIGEFGSYPQVGTDDFIPESLFYLLGMKANNEAAKKFQMWLATDVLPSMRKHGMYATDELLDNPDLLIAAATKLKEERAARLKAEKEKEEISKELERKNRFINQIAVSENSVLVREVAKIASKNNVVIGEKRLWSKLREWGLIFKNSTEPKQCGVDRGYFEVNEGTKEAKGKVFTYRTTRVTGKGQAYIIERLLKEA